MSVIGGEIEVRYHPEAEREFATMPPPEKVAMQSAVEKLKVLGDRLPFPHSSKVRGTASLRELRPRAGRSPWRAFYRRIENAMVIGAIGPEADSNRHGFARSVNNAVQRLDEVEGKR